MKIALITDTHFGARNDNPAYANYFFKFYNNVFFPYLKEHNIKTCIHLGDIVDRRKFINFKTSHDFRHKFMRRLWEEKIDTHIIVGNHDTYYKNTNEVNAVDELLTTYDGINEPFIYSDPKVVEIGGMRMLFLPWKTSRLPTVATVSFISGQKAPTTTVLWVEALLLLRFICLKVAQTLLGTHIRLHYQRPLLITSRMCWMLVGSVIGVNLG